MKMSLNWNTNKTQNYVDKEHNMMLSQGGGHGDSIGRTMDAYFCYEDNRFIEGITKCWEKVNKPIKLFKLIPIRKYHHQGYRFPIRYEGEEGLSRDHTIYTIIAYKLAGYSNENLKRFVKHLRWKISDRYTFTPDSWLSIRSIAGIKWAEALFYLITIPMMWGAAIHNKRIYKKASFHDEVSQDEFVITKNEDKSEEFKKYTRKLYPVYALTNLSMQLYVMRDS